MTSNDKYALNWDNHTCHMKRAFDSLRRTNDFVDVTLCCEGKKLKAHRMILSACSAYFHDILSENPCPHPIVILRDVSYHDMLGILEFMYLGEVQVSTERFSSFLKVAELFKVSGLAEDLESKEMTSPSEATKEAEETELMKTGVKRTRSHEKKFSEKEADKEEKMLSKKKKATSVSPALMNTDGIAMEETEGVKGDMSRSVASVQQLLNTEEYLSKEMNPENECPFCAKQFPTMHLLKQHIPFHLGETKCEYCSTVFSRKDLLKKHLMAVHKKGTSKKD